MQGYRVEITIQSSFATPPKGDTLFGYFCWMLAEKKGSSALTTLLEGYTQGKPFAIFSDLLVGDHILFPPIPHAHLGITFDPKERKTLKRQRALSLQKLSELGNVIDKDTKKECEDISVTTPTESIQIRNHINRLIDTTGESFDPFASKRFDWEQQKKATLYLLLDTNRLSKEDGVDILEAMGLSGFGKDATIGRGRFRVDKIEPFHWESQGHNALITLSPSILSGQGFTEAYYEPFTRFGKHGGWLSHGTVWKNPILMADSFALVKAENPPQFIGKGLGGDGTLSVQLYETVHQGYAVALPVTFGEKR
jgi:CRISPR-associated protein Csm4